MQNVILGGNGQMRNIGERVLDVLVVVVLVVSWGLFSSYLYLRSRSSAIAKNGTIRRGELQTGNVIFFPLLYGLSSSRVDGRRMWPMYQSRNCGRRDIADDK